MATITIPGSYLHIEADEEFIIVLKAILIEILVDMDLKLYRKCIMLETGVNLKCVKLQNSLYGLLRSALLFYPKISNRLEK